MVVALRKKVAATKDPWKNLKLTYSQGTRDKGYTEEEDAFLVCALDKVGYGNWSDLQREIRISWQFRFVAFHCCPWATKTFEQNLFSWKSKNKFVWLLSHS